MLKILHTSDLHIGKRLYQAELNEEQSMFFQWMVDYIRQNDIKVLLISGDVFDVANPSSESRKIYFELLRELMMLKCKVIIAGGNHDSPAVLEAPKELLRYLDIHVTGSLPSNPSDLLVPVALADGTPELLVACIPYLRDADLRKYNQDETYEDRVEAIRKGIASVFHQAAAQCQENYPGVPALAMGHLYVQGSDISESERDIQIGNLAGLEVSQLPGYFSYYALGHLHKPQQPGKNFVYSGSPVQLSFSESANHNRVMLITADQGVVNHESISVPLNRRLIRMQGTVAELDRMLRTTDLGQGALPDFIELIAEEENHDPSKLLHLESIIGSFQHEKAVILKYRIHFINSPLGTASLYEETQSIAEMKPLDVFQRRMETEGLEESVSAMLLEAFSELLEEVELNRDGEL
jgi:exonuclease SbcD